MRTVLGVALEILLFAYLLPGILIGLLAYGLGVVIWSLVDALRRADFADRRPPRGFARFILNVAVPRRHRDDFMDDLREENELRALRDGPAATRAWLREQVGRSIAAWFLWRLARLVDFVQSDQFAAWAIRVALCVYLLPALIVVALVSLVGIGLGLFMDTMRRPPWGPVARRGREFIRRVIDGFRRFLERRMGSRGGGPRRDRRSTGRPAVRPGATETPGMMTLT